MDRIDMSQDALLDALQEALGQTEDPEGAMTIREISAKLDLNERSAREVVRGLIEDGRAEATKVRRVALDGRNALVSAYRLLDE